MTSDAPMPFDDFPDTYVSPQPKREHAAYYMSMRPASVKLQRPSLVRRLVDRAARIIQRGRNR